MKIEGQAALITGGGGGLGAGTARALASAGAKVALLDSNIGNAISIAQEIGGIAIECDVSNEASGVNAIETARSKHGPARILVNCAGIAPAEKIVGKNGAMPLDNFRHVIEVNLIGTFNLIRLAAADIMKLANNLVFRIPKLCSYTIRNKQKESVLWVCFSISREWL